MQFSVNKWLRTANIVILLAALLFSLVAMPVLAQEPPPRPGEPSQPPSLPQPLPPPPPPDGGGGSGGSGAQPAVIAGGVYSLGGGQIRVTASPGSMTGVQWQDGAGNWNDVPAWRAVASDGTVTWSVEPKDYGTGPFRWVSYGSDGYRVMGTSDSFYLPSGDQSVSVSISGGYYAAPGGYDYAYGRPAGGQPATAYGRQSGYGYSAQTYAYQQPSYAQPYGYAQGYSGYTPPAYNTGGYVYGQQRSYGTGGYLYGSGYGYGSGGYQSGYANQYYRGAYSYSCWCFSGGRWYNICGR